AYRRAGGNLTRAARLLGGHRATLYRHMQALGLTRDDLAAAPTTPTGAREEGGGSLVYQEPAGQRLAEQNPHKRDQGTHPHHGSALRADALGACPCIPGDVLVPRAGQAAALGAADHVIVWIMSPLTAGHLVGDLDPVAVRVPDVDTDGMAVVRHTLDLYVLLFNAEVQLLQVVEAVHIPRHVVEPHLPF